MKLRRGVAVVLVLASCKAAREPEKETTEAESAAPPPPIRVATDRTDLVFSYAKDARTFETANVIGDIPEDRRQAVVVTDLSLSPEERQSGRYIYVADLTKPRGDGSFPVAVASRYGFESALTQTSTTGGPSSEGVVVYTTSWCGACKQAKRLLRSWKVPFVEKDVEASAKAQRELAQKAAARGLRPSGVPVIDVAGELLMGLDEATLRRTLEAKKLL